MYEIENQQNPMQTEEYAAHVKRLRQCKSYIYGLGCLVIYNTHAFTILPKFYSLNTLYIVHTC